MNMNLKKGKAAIMILLIMMVFILLLVLFPSYDNEIYRTNYLIDVICLTVLLCMYVVGYLLDKYDFFSPITFFSFLYFFMFFITPIYDLLIGEILWFNKDLFLYGIKGSLYAFLGYLCFYAAYVLCFRGDNCDLSFNEDVRIKNSRNTRKLNVLIVMGYFICLIANMFYMTKSGGKSILYILTLGLLGSGDPNDITENLGAIGMLSYCLPSFTLMYCEYGESKLLKVLFFVLMFQLQVARGFRFIIIQIIIMFVFYWRLSRNRPFKFIQVFSVLLLLLASIIVMTMFRDAVRSGSGVNLSEISLKAVKKALDAAFWDNLRIYKNFYAIIMVVPEKTPYLLGKQMIIYTVIMLVPRAIWHNKPGNPGTTATRISLGMVAVKGGSAYPCLGEYFYEFGLPGILIFMTIFGLWTKKYEYKLRIHRSSNIDLMKYCTLVGVILQLVIRGYTPSNFWLVVFCLIPYWFIDNYIRTSNREQACLYDFGNEKI